MYIFLHDGMFIDRKDGLIEWILDRFIPYRVYTSFMIDNLFAPVAQQCISKEETKCNRPRNARQSQIRGIYYNIWKVVE
jgi:hypothetical protein